MRPLLLQWRMEGRIEQEKVVGCLKQGSCGVIASLKAAAFDPHELKLLANGISSVNDAELRAACRGK